MKLNKLIPSFILVAALVFSSKSSTAQALKTPAPSPQQTIEQAFGLSNLKIEYSRPSVKGRVIFGDLVPYGKIWRTGANAATKITFGDDVKIDGKTVVAGTYAIYTIPGNDSWEVLIYKDLKLGGSVADYKSENELMRLKVKPTSSINSVETFTINIANMTSTSATIEMLWDKTRIAFNVTTDIDEKVMKNIETALEKDTRPYYQAANYYFENGKDLATALKWVNIAAESNPKAYWIMHTKAKIQNKMNDTQGAMVSVQKSLEMSKEDKNDDFVKLNEKLMAEIKKGK